VWQGGERGESELLASCYRRSIEIAHSKGLASLAFPSISTGIYSYPIELAASVAIKTIRAAALTAPELREVIFCCFTASDLAVYEKALNEPAA
jgi:O-acetyl-ADP-ribose deacetylase (regulator of RNase III)